MWVNTSWLSKFARCPPSVARIDSTRISKRAIRTITEAWEKGKKATRWLWIKMGEPIDSCCWEPIDPSKVTLVTRGWCWKSWHSWWTQEHHQACLPVYLYDMTLAIPQIRKLSKVYILYLLTKKLHLAAIKFHINSLFYRLYTIINWK